MENSGILLPCGKQSAATHHFHPQGERANGVTEYKTSKLVKESLKPGIMKALEGKVALGPFQEEEMVLHKLPRGQRHLRSSTSKFVENPRRRKLGRQRICSERQCNCVSLPVKAKFFAEICVGGCLLADINKLTTRKLR